MSNVSHWKKILVPTDFSEDALKALKEAQQFQSLMHVQVVLLHVTEPAFDGLRIHSGHSGDHITAIAKKQLKELSDEYFPGCDDVSILVKDGRAAEVICELAKTMKIDAIFIATHGISALKHFVLGSVAEKVVRHAPCSVLVVR